MHQPATTMVSDTTLTTQSNAAPPGLGKWNRSKRRLKLQQEPHRKKTITKEERREKYTAIAKERQLKKQQKDLTCFRCRQMGHSIQYCTNAAAVGIDDNGTVDVKPTDHTDYDNTDTSETMSHNIKKNKSHKSPIVAPICCYRCGSTEHNLASCPSNSSSKHKKAASELQHQELPFATCFICQERGHIASQCQQNQHGIYVQGTGQCKYCQSKFHRGSQCPDKSKSKSKSETDHGRLEDFDTSDLLDNSNDNANQNQAQSTSTASRPNTKSKKRVVKF